MAKTPEDIAKLEQAQNAALNKKLADLKSLPDEAELAKLIGEADKVKKVLGGSSD